MAQVFDIFFLEAVLNGYLEVELVPFAVRLGSKLLDEGKTTKPGGASD